MSKVGPKKRRQTATITQGKGKDKRYRFPMPDKEHARKALQMLPKAKGLSAEERAKVKARANRKLYGTAKPTKKQKGR